MIASVVERATFKRCRRKWWLTSDTQENLEPIALAPALLLGGMIQEALSYWTERPDSDPVESFAKLSENAIIKYSDLYYERHEFPISDLELDEVYKVIELGMAMTTNYRDYYKAPLPAGFHVIQTEQRMLVDIPNTEHWECNNCGYVYYDVDVNWKPDDILLCQDGCMQPMVTWQSHKLRGTLDSLLQNKDGRVFPLERKTYAARPEVSKLQHDDQMLAYDWMISKIYPNQVGGTLYDGLWKRAAPPNTKSSRTGQKNTIEDLFYRDIFYRPQAERDEFEALLAIEVNDMCRAKQEQAYYINRQWMGCFDCGVEKLCSAMSRGEDTTYIRETYYHPRPSEGFMLFEMEAE